MQRSEGAIGEVAMLLVQAATAALLAGRESIDPAAIEAADYQPPSLRRRLFERNLHRAVRRWPLHPKPCAWESLDAYVRRLADIYGVRHETFGRRALGIEAEIARDLDRAPRQVLERLAAGTGVSLARLEDMRGDRLWARLADEIGRLLATDEGRGALARFQATAPLHKS